MKRLPVRNRTGETERTFLMSEYGRQKLLAYADSFNDLAHTLGRGEKRRENGGIEGEKTRQQIIYHKRMEESRDILADNMEKMAQVMRQVAGEVFACSPFPSARKKEIAFLFSEQGLLVNDVYYIEEKKNRIRIGIVLRAKRPVSLTAENVADMLSVLLDVRLVPAMNCPYEIDRELRSYILVEEAGFTVLTGVAKAMKEGEPCSGDNFAVLESEKGRMCIFLSDGMGSGEIACQDSEEVVDLMEKLMEAGYGMKEAAELVNSTLLAGAEEAVQNMSTLDVCEVDLYDGICEFLKIGAAPSYIKRGHMVEQISAGNLPLGLLAKPEEIAACRRLMDGDYVFLLSDGITDALDNCDYKEDVSAIISSLDKESPKELAADLLQVVLRKTGGHIPDDMTILVFGIWENM